MLVGESLCPLMLDEERERRKAIKKSGENSETLNCIAQMSAQNSQPEKLKHRIFLVRKFKISSHCGEDLDFVTAFQISLKMSEFRNMIGNIFNINIKDILFTDGEVTGSHYSFQNPD